MNGLNERIHFINGEKAGMHQWIAEGNARKME